MTRMWYNIETKYKDFQYFVEIQKNINYSNLKRSTFKHFKLLFKT